MDASVPRSNPTLRRESAVALAAFSSLTAGAALTGLRASRQPATWRWYRRLRKPSFQPPASVFGPVWSALYVLMALSAWRVWNRSAGASRSQALALWGVQLGFNAAWSWLFFSRRRPRAALADIAALASSLAAYTATASRVDPLAAWMMGPYLAWVGFASLLNTRIVQLNPHRA